MKNIPRRSLKLKKKAYFCNSCLWNWNPTHFRQQEQSSISKKSEICFADAVA